MASTSATISALKLLIQRDMRRVKKNEARLAEMLAVMSDSSVMSSCSDSDSDCAIVMPKKVAVAAVKKETEKTARNFAVKAELDEISRAAEAKAEATAKMAKAVVAAKALAKVEALAEAKALAKVEALAEAKALARAEAVAEAKAIARAEAVAEVKAHARAEALMKAEIRAEAKALAEAEAMAEAEAVAEAEALTDVKVLSKSLADALARGKALERDVAKAQALNETTALAVAAAEVAARAAVKAAAKAAVRVAAKSDTGSLSNLSVKVVEYTGAPIPENEFTVSCMDKMEIISDILGLSAGFKETSVSSSNAFLEYLTHKTKAQLSDIASALCVDVSHGSTKDTSAKCIVDDLMSGISHDV